MGSTNTFWKGMLIGALAGGAVTLLDKETRRAVAGSCKKGTQKVTYCLTHPTEMVQQVKEQTAKLRHTVEQVSEDVSFIAEKVDELREVTPTVAGIVQDTKEVFSKDKKDGAD